MYTQTLNCVDEPRNLCVIHIIETVVMPNCTVPMYIHTALFALKYFQHIMQAYICMYVHP